MKAKILLVGEHPLGSSGNSHMMAALLEQVDKEKYDVSVFSATESPALVDIYQDNDFYVFDAGLTQDFGAAKLINVIFTSKPNVVVFVGIDIWRYAPIWKQLTKLRQQIGFIWSAIFPYDSDIVRPDWIKWIKSLDIPCVYSQAGYILLKEAGVDHIQYFRPNLYKNEMFVPYSDDKRKALRNSMFPDLPEDAFIFGFIGNNQFRKDPQRLIKAFFDFSSDYPNAALYLHTKLAPHGHYIFNLMQYIQDCEATYGKRILIAKRQDYVYSMQEMVNVYNILDCLVNVSLQEGLSWTLLEAMLCGVPVIASKNTAQKDLIEPGAMGVLSNQVAYLPSFTESGSSFIEASACDYDDLKDAMVSMIEYKEIRDHYREEGLQIAKDWISNVSNINYLFDTAIELRETINYKIPESEKIKKILFAQHSSAGDVFMTTRCFKSLLERHPGYKMDYMTMPQYKEVVVNNPYIDEVIDWDENKLKEYQFVYNPHGDRILPGHWGRNSNSLLSDFYWKILRVKPDDFYIALKEPDDKELVKFIEEENECPIALVHTTGGDPHFRTYKYMKEVCEYLASEGYLTIQVGGQRDFPAGAAIDLRGKLNHQKTAWVASKSTIAVTVDSFVSHLCGAFGVSQICLFGSGNYNVVKPNQMQGELICMIPDYVNDCPGLGPCSASVKDCPTPCTGGHDPKDIIKNLQIIIRKQDEKLRINKFLQDVEKEVKQSKGE